MNSYEDLEFLNSAYEKATSIKIKYDLLSTLKSCYMDDSIIYKRTLEELNNLFEEESELYSDLDVSAENISSLLNVLKYQNKINNPCSEVEDILLHVEKNDLAWERVSKKLKYLANLDKKEKGKIIKMLMNEDISELDMDDYVNNIIKKVDYNIEAITNDFYRAFLFFFNEEVNKSDDIELGKFSFYLSLISPTVENILMKNNFNFDHELYIYNRMAADITNTTEIELNVEINHICYKKAIDSIRDLLQITDNVFPNKKSEVIINRCLLKSSLVLLDVDNQNYLKHEVDLILRGLENKDRINQAIQTIQSVFNDIKKDKSKVSLLSLKPYN